MERKQNKEQIGQIWRLADAVCFDVDSTVCTGEGLDDLAEFCGKGEQVKQMTTQAMGGAMEFREALFIRLDILRPSLDQVHKFLRQKPPQLTPGISELFMALRAKGVTPYLVSGGFDCIIEPVANQLGVPLHHVFANKLLFSSDGAYQGFDETQPTSRSGGKRAVIELLKNSPYGHKQIVMIGDGATDLEACPPADAFIGFGGNIVRESVRQQSGWFITHFQELITALESP